MLDKADYSTHSLNTKNIHTSHISGLCSKTLLVKVLALTHRASNVHLTTLGFCINLIKCLTITFGRVKWSYLCYIEDAMRHSGNVFDVNTIPNYESSTDRYNMLFVCFLHRMYLPTAMVWYVYSLWWGGLSDCCVGLYRVARIHPPPPSPQMLQSSWGTRRKLCILNMHKLTLCSLLGMKRPVLTCAF